MGLAQTVLMSHEGLLVGKRARWLRSPLLRVVADDGVDFRLMADLGGTLAQGGLSGDTCKGGHLGG